jgi:hypothetical protein
LTKSLSTILLLALIGGTIYYYREEWKDLLFPTIPCTEPITYSIGDFDERFDISREDFKATIEKAEEIWEEAVDKELFTYSATGTLKVNLIYDYRQQATEKLNDVGIAINKDKETYDEIRVRYESMRAEYDKKEASFQKDSAQFDKDKAAYDKEVAYWNDQGGAPADKYEELRAEGRELSERASVLNKRAKELNSLSSEINGTATILNDLAKTLNMKVSVFNDIGASTGEEFNEGVYVRDASGERINVYQFDTTAKLRRLLEHELGHALGLDHVEDSKAIMYRLNSSENEELTAADLTELQSVCQAS